MNKIIKVSIYYFLFLYITIYSYIKVFFINCLPTFIYISTDDNNIVKYICKYKHKLYIVKFIDHPFVNLSHQIEEFKNNLDKNIKSRQSINHCCVKENDEEYTKDITEKIREFIHYLDQNKFNFNMWTYIKAHLKVKKDVYIYLNDNNSTEIIIQQENDLNSYY